jgi:hypothetical protein
LVVEEELAADEIIQAVSLLEQMAVMVEDLLSLLQELLR